MGLMFLRWQLLRGCLMRRVVLGALLLILLAIEVSLMQLAHDFRALEPSTTNIKECPLNLGSNPEFNITGFMKPVPSFRLPLLGASPLSWAESKNLTRIVFKELMEKNLLQTNARALCVGEKSASAVLALRYLGLFNASGVDRHPFFSLFKGRFVYDLNFEDNHLDFVFSDDLDRVSFPALVVMEIERVLRPGGTGAVLVGPRTFYSGGLVRSATPIASFFKNSDVHLCSLGSYELIIFKKGLENFASFENIKLPADCPSITNNKPFLKYIEPLADKSFGRIEPHLSYLPNFMNISSRNKVVYVNIGSGEYAKTSIAKMSKHYHSDHHAAFEAFIIDHKTSVLSACVTDPGINFVYYPALSGDASAAEISSDEFLTAPVDEESFDFIRWFKETVSVGDFVLMMMKAKLVELNILVELFKSGAICYVDELFLRCSDAGGCTNIFKSLRNSGVYVHQWLGD